GENFYGYNDFSLDITDYVTCDGKTENVISVKAVNEFPSSRWYSGSGIYRDVTLTVSGDIHVADEGTYVTTPNLEEEQNGDVTVGRVNYVLSVQDVVLYECDLLNFDILNLFYVQSEFLYDVDVFDSFFPDFGFRYLEYDSVLVFKLNGEIVKMKGVCMHHDQG